MKISSLQEKILKKANKFLKFGKFTELELSRNGYFYFCPFAPTKGNAKLLSFIYKLSSFKVYLYATLTDCIKIFRFSGFETLQPQKLKNYKFIVVNWGTYTSFNKRGEYFDKHLNVSSQYCKNVLWYIIYLDKKIPKKISNNIVIVNEIKKFSFFNLISIFKKLLSGKIRLNIINQEISNFSLLSNYVYQNFDKYIVNAKKVLIPYEGQPFQNAIFKKVSEIKPKIMTVGFVHSFPIGLPSNFIKRSGHPQKLILNSLSQKYSFLKYLGWSKNELKVLPSSRFKKKIKEDMGNKIYLPIKFYNYKSITSSLIYLINYLKMDLSKLEIKNHPSCLKSKKHIKLVKLIDQTIKENKHRKKIEKNMSIFIGATGSVIEALERDYNIFHITEKPVLECYTKKIWKYIDATHIGNNLFNYKKIKNNKLIIFNNNKKIYRKYIF